MLALRLQDRSHILNYQELFLRPLRRRFPADHRKACHVLWLVYVGGTSQTEAALLVGLNVGTVCHIVHGRRFPGAYPVPFSGA